ncbi:MAG: extracellular solute-binding protein, partial [Verrucomicrobiaceae bacterium]|nr:extracellular solute-binding protein [Verrucomicrobiaceae bacterium]
MNDDPPHAEMEGHAKPNTPGGLLERFLQHPLVRRVAAWLRAHPKECGVVMAVGLVLIGPFLLKPADSTTPRRWDRKLVILTPHTDRIREEFGQAFAAHWKATTGETLYIDWRVPGGTSEIAMLIKSEFTAAFQRHWETEKKKTWTSGIAQTCLNLKVEPPKTGVPLNDEQQARLAFLDSQIGIGMDVMFGGGAYDFEQQAKAGTLVAGDGEKTGISSLMVKHPAWFGEAGIPEKLSGEPFRDAQGKWSGACISQSGIVYNKDVLKRLGIEKEPDCWQDLADPRYFGHIALTDPAKSGSVAKVFEMLIQQQMQMAVEDAKSKPPGKRTPEEIELEGVETGWMNGMRLIQRIAANARYFSDTSTKIPLEVMRGEAAAGMCIDFYGRSAQEDVRQADGGSRVGFVAPVGGTSISVDPIAMFRGAPNAEVAT